MTSDTLRVSAPTIVARGERTYYHVRVEGLERPKLLWFSLPNEHASLLTDASDGVAVGLLITAMDKFRRLELDGWMSEKLLHNLRGPMQYILRQFYPDLNEIEIQPKEVRSDGEPAPGVMASYSGGVDSLTVVIDHHYKDCLPGFRLTHLMYNNTGSHGVPGRRWFRRRYGRLAPGAARTGLPFLDVDSNLATFYSPVHKFDHTHPIRNIAVGLLLQSGIGRYLVASDFPYAQVSFGRGQMKGLPATGPIFMPLLSTERLEFLFAAGHFTRPQKTLHVADCEDTHDVLDVCKYANHDRTNCSRCEKCMRTQMTLEIGGKLDRYSKQFNRAVYKSERTGHFARLLFCRDPYSAEVRALMREKNFRLPPHYYPLGLLLHATDAARDFKRRFIPVGPP